MRSLPPARFAILALLLVLGGCSAPRTAVMGAAPAPRTEACEIARVEALRAINAARASARRCGSRQMAAAPPLHWNLQLQWAADAHAQDMASKDYLEHRSPSGDSVRERVRSQNYPWRHVGENIAGGTETVDHTVEAWLESPSHCENLMEPDYRDAALACAERVGTEYENYWALVMARK